MYKVKDAKMILIRMTSISPKNSPKIIDCFSKSICFFFWNFLLIHYFEVPHSRRKNVIDGFSHETHFVIGSEQSDKFESRGHKQDIWKL